MPRKLHAVGASNQTECGIRLDVFPSMISTTDASAVTCKSCQNALRRNAVVTRMAMVMRARAATTQSPFLTREDLVELKEFIEASLLKLAGELRPPATSRYLGVSECAAYLSRTPKALRRLAEDRAIPHIRIDRRLMFDRETIDRWMERRSKRVLRGRRW